MWPHFIHLFWRIVHGMPVLVSSNWAASFIGGLTFLVTEFVLFMITPREQRWKRLISNLLIGLAVTTFVYSTLFVWSTVQTVYDNHHDSVGRWQAVVQEKNALKESLQQRDTYIHQLEGKTCPACSRSGKAITVVQPKPTLWELCSILTKCPTPEVQRRALLLADEIDELFNEFVRDNEKARIESQHMPGTQGEQATFYASRQRFLFSHVITTYREKYQGSAFALRKELINRIGDPGENDSIKDNEYLTPNLPTLHDISGDLRRLASDPRLPSPVKGHDENKK